MNWNKFNAGWDKILHLCTALATPFANIATFNKTPYAEILFLKKENPRTINGIARIEFANRLSCEDL